MFWSKHLWKNTKGKRKGSVLSKFFNCLFDHLLQWIFYISATIQWSSISGQVVYRVTTSNNEWYNGKRVTKCDKEWYNGSNEWQRVVLKVAKIGNEWYNESQWKIILAELPFSNNLVCMSILKTKGPFHYGQSYCKQW